MYKNIVKKAFNVLMIALFVTTACKGASTPIDYSASNALSQAAGGAGWLAGKAIEGGVKSFQYLGDNPVFGGETSYLGSYSGTAAQIIVLGIILSKTPGAFEWFKEKVDQYYKTFKENYGGKYIAPGGKLVALSGAGLGLLLTMKNLGEVLLKTGTGTPIGEFGKAAVLPVAYALITKLLWDATYWETPKKDEKKNEGQKTNADILADALRALAAPAPAGAPAVPGGLGGGVPGAPKKEPSRWDTINKISAGAAAGASAAAAATRWAGNKVYEGLGYKAVARAAVAPSASGTSGQSGS